jgi:hypothetical protein
MEQRVIKILCITALEICTGVRAKLQVTVTLATHNLGLKKNASYGRATRWTAGLRFPARAIYFSLSLQSTPALTLPPPNGVATGSRRPVCLG